MDSPSIPHQDVLVALVRLWLRKGVSQSVLKSSVRLRSLDKFTGGLKADLVGLVNIAAKGVVKSGDAELLLHQTLMNKVNEIAQGKLKGTKAIFPEVMIVAPQSKLLGNEKEKKEPWFMLMQEFSKYQTLEDSLFQGHRDFDFLQRALTKTIDNLSFMHSIRPWEHRILKKLPQTLNPFSNRLLAKLKQITDCDPKLECLWNKPGMVLGEKIPPLRELLERIQNWENGQTRPEKRLVHGDCHLGNIMVRKGRGVAVRFIDPNPTVGFSDRFYDWGKLFHFLEPIGWIRNAKEKCTVRFQNTSKAWRLDYTYPSGRSKVEKVRSRLEGWLFEQMRHRVKLACDAEIRAALGRASAHVGFAAIKTRKAELLERRFALGVCLSSLANIDLK